MYYVSICLSIYLSIHLSIYQALKRYSEEWIVQVEDITDFVHEQYKLVKSRKTDGLLVAEERIYVISDPKVAAQIELAPTPS